MSHSIKHESKVKPKIKKIFNSSSSNGKTSNRRTKEPFQCWLIMLTKFIDWFIQKFLLINKLSARFTFDQSITLSSYFEIEFSIEYNFGIICINKTSRQKEILWKRILYYIWNSIFTLFLIVSTQSFITPFSPSRYYFVGIVDK